MQNEALNFSLDAHYGHAERYERANEFAEVVTALWDSWDDDAFMRDKESGQFFDPKKMHYLNHRGTATSRSEARSTSRARRRAGR